MTPAVPAPRRSGQLPRRVSAGLVRRPEPASFVMPCPVCRRCMALDRMRWLPGAGIRRVACDLCAPIVAAGQQ